MTVSVARQPIVTAEKKIIGYELLYREDSCKSFRAKNPDQATSDVIFKSFLDIGLDTITDNNTAFINFTKNSLIQRVPLLLPASKMMVEILEDIEVSPEILHILQELKEKDYQIALDDFILTEKSDSFLPFADIVKIDWQDSDVTNIKNVVQASKVYSFTLLAEKLETKSEFEKAKSMGFTLFQGYYFGHPLIVK
ncbi:EAL and modified HD-GYP domain-containing signal transduction protein [Salibacterium salarium]|uniref:EAL and HDOD domain-containing protein n=1 Tax=Salibacterium salarium TaxID=284579 RepID=UPI002784DDF4|nr:EAL domain-containing protein [Salibacterium salarium]MDQ0300783.1 EAL and modified HD-GYP domain-containing signal transduction protein [Salibacterium salarium]